MPLPMEKPKPRLPVQQLCILAIVRFAEPLALTSVFPYLPEMIASFGVPRDEIARWAGITSAIFSISQSMTAVLWGRTSDTIGRKPTLILGMICTMFCFLFWGTAGNLTMAIIVRAIQGCGNGNVGIIRTVVAELVPEKSLQPVAFSIMPMVWSVGAVFGPAFGGFFARPAEQYPAIFGNSKLLIRFPFLLPNLIAGIFFMCSLVTAILFLRETLESKRHRADWGLRLGQKLVSLFRFGRRPKNDFHSHHHRHHSGDDESSAPLLSTSNSDDLEGTPDGVSLPAPAIPTSQAPPDNARNPPASSSISKILTYQTCMVLLSYTMLALHSVAYDQIVPVFLNYPHQVPDETNTKLPFKFSGGFDMTSGHIGTMFTITAVVSALAQFVIFPPLCARFGVLPCCRLACIILPFVYFLTPYTVLVQNTHLRFAAFIFLFIAKGCLGIVTFPCITIILTNSAPSLSVLGTLNGIATTVSGLGRAAGPAMTGTAFTWGVKHGYIITGWWLLAIIAALGAIPPFFMSQGEGLNRPMEPEDDEDEDSSAFDDDNYEEELLPEDDGVDVVENVSIVHTGSEPTTTRTHPHSRVNSNQWNDQTSSQQRKAALLQQAGIPEPEEPEQITADGTRLADVDISAPTPPRAGRFRSVSNLSRLAAKDTAREDDVPLSPVDSRK